MRKERQIDKMNVIEINIDELKPYENNPRHNEAAVGPVANSIKEFGFKVPIIIDKDNVIIAGHTRLKAAKLLGLETVPCVLADDLTEKQAKAFRLADNKVSELAEWNFDDLEKELEELDAMDLDFEMSDFGFESSEIGGGTEQIEEDDFNEDLPEEPKAKIGDLYQLGNHRLICGDSTDINVIDRLMDGQKADMVFTDPPYGMNAVSKSGVLSEHYKQDIMGDDDNTVAIDAFNMAAAYFKDAKQIWWGANYYTECIPSSECWIVWDKNNGASDQTDCELAYSNLRSVVRKFTMTSEKTDRVHPTQKPIKLFDEIIHKFDKDNSINNVVDLFGGSGSTLIACEQLKRNCFMAELDPKYVDVIIARWEKFTGKEAKLVNE